MAVGCLTINEKGENLMEEFKSAYPVLPDYFLEIEDGGLTGCTYHGDREYAVRIPSSVAEIGRMSDEDGNFCGSSPFEGCTGLREVYIPGSVTTIADDAFCGCTGLKKVTIADGVTAIGSNAFTGCTGLTQVTIPGSVAAIGAWAFSNCTGLTEVTISDGVVVIGLQAFVDCVNLREVHIPGMIWEIGGNAFSKSID
jgi:hypothetical protein